LPAALAPVISIQALSSFSYAETTPSALEAADQLDELIGRRSGLLGMSGVSHDMRALRAAIDEGNPRARLAVDKFTWTIARWIGSFFAELGGLDMLVFTGGIGENSIETRAEVCAGLGALGIVLDPVRNNVRGTAIVSASHSPVTVRVMSPLEDLVIVNHVVRLMQPLAPERSEGAPARELVV
jgi:acetate kinase